jgi:hypothetical protein
MSFIVMHVHFRMFLLTMMIMGFILGCCAQNTVFFSPKLNPKTHSGFRVNRSLCALLLTKISTPFGEYDLEHSKSPISTHVKWVPVTTVWRVLRLRVEESASRYGR